MTQEELFDFAVKLKDCSVYMKEFDMNISNVLIDIASEVADLLKKETMPEELRNDVDSIKDTLLND